MASEAIVTKIEPDLAGGIIVHMILSDGVSQKVEREYRIKRFVLDDFKRRVQADLDELSSTGSQKISLPLGVFDTTITTAIPTQVETDKQKFFAALTTLRHYINAASLGILAADDPNYLVQLKLVQDTYKDAYLEMF